MYYVYKRRPSALSGGQLFYATFAINRFGLVSLQRVLKKLKTSISSIQSLDVTGNWDVSHGRWYLYGAESNVREQVRYESSEQKGEKAQRNVELLSPGTDPHGNEGKMSK